MGDEAAPWESDPGLPGPKPVTAPTAAPAADAAPWESAPPATAAPVSNETPDMSLRRLGGLATRSLLQGTADIADLGPNLMNLSSRAELAIENAGRRLLGMPKNENEPYTAPTLAHDFEKKQLDNLGLPEPATKGERIGSAGLEALPSAILGPESEFLAPYASAAASGAGSQWAAEDGAGPLTQFATGVAAGAVPGAIHYGPTAVRAVKDRFTPPEPPPKKYTPEEAVAGTVDKQSMGAAAVPPDVSVASQKLRDAISETASNNGGKIPNQTALHRHLDIAQLPMPEGETPPELREGQATGDAQRISDELNFHTDKATQGLITKSITDQDKKLRQSTGEIQRRANPDMVGLTSDARDQAAIRAIKEQDNVALKDIKDKYQALADANGGTVPIDTGQAIGDIEAQLRKKNRFNVANNDGTMSEILDKIRSGKPIDFETFEDMRSDLAAVQRGGGRESQAAQIIREHLENMPLTKDAAKLKGLADDARAAAKARYDTIEANPAYKAAAEDNVKRSPAGLHDLSVDSPLGGGRFLDKYAVGYGPEASPEYVRRLKQAVPSADLSHAMEAEAIDRLRGAAKVDATGGGAFAYASYRDALNKMEQKGKDKVLFQPQTIENVQRLKRAAFYINDLGGKAESVNKSGTAMMLARHGAVLNSTDPSTTKTLINHAIDLKLGAISPALLAGKKFLDARGKELDAAAALKSIEDAKLRMAENAVRPGAGLDVAEDASGAVTPKISQPDSRTPRAAGGKVTDDMLVNRLTRRWQAAKRATDETTKPLLNVPDNAIIRALDIAQEHL